ncbi:MAG: N-acetylmuramoyl-L-alanine amidase [Azospirillaceae bacterium]|nr:N-acetylmuramoyl-L-alanine amidase [Azospirillaceae bacterium]
MIPDRPAIIDLPSPNHGPRPPGTLIDILLVHYTGMPDAAQALDRLRDPASQVSAHYLIDEDGTLIRLVAEQRRAWHAGLSWWRGARDINSRSIGIELVNPGHDWGYRSFPAAQMAGFVALARDIMARHGITAGGVIGHSDVAPDRKRDPGEQFDWAALAGHGIGLWPQPDAGDDGPWTEAELRDLLGRIGYRPVLDPALLVAAFQRHWRPDAVTGQVDADTARRIRALARIVA